MSQKIKLLVTLANHEIPPRTDTPGIGWVIHNQLQEMDYTRFDISAVCIETNQGAEVESPKYKNTRLTFRPGYFALLHKTGRHFRKFLFGITDTKKIYRNLQVFFFAAKSIRRYDVILVHNYPLTAIWLKAFARLFNPKLRIVYYYHSSRLEWFISQYPGIISVDGIVTIAGDELKAPPTCNIINNHKRQSSALGVVPKTRELRLVYSSNIDPNKGTLQIVTAVRNTAQLGYPVQLDIYGKAKDEKYFADVMDIVNSTPCINYKGQVKNNVLLQVLPSYDAVILLSQQMEGNSMSLIEAIVEARLPAIASVIGGTPLVLDQGRFGALVRHYETSAELEQVLIDLIQKPELLTAYKNNIEAGADEYFSPQRSALRLSAFLEQILRSS